MYVPQLAGVWFNIQVTYKQAYNMYFIFKLDIPIQCAGATSSSLHSG